MFFCPNQTLFSTLHHFPPVIVNFVNTMYIDFENRKKMYCQPSWKICYITFENYYITKNLTFHYNWIIHIFR